MAIDFTNRWTPDGTNARDANAVVSVTPSKAVWYIKTSPDGAWLGAPTSDPAVGNQPGYRSVGVATVLLADGREFRAVLDGSGQPISEVGDQLAASDEGTKQRAVFTQLNNAATPNSGSPTQPRKAADGLTHIYQWNPQTRQYDIDLGSTEAPATAPHVEGTPLPGGGYDNTQPIVVNRDPSGRQIGPARELTADERARWEREKNAAAGLGSKTDAELQSQGSDSKPLEGYPGWIIRTTKVGNDTKTVFINPQGQEAQDPRPATPTAAETTTTVTRNGTTYIQHTVKRADGSSDTYFTNQQGARVELPNESRPGQVVTVNGEQFWATPNADPGKPPTLTRMDPGAGNLPTDAGPQMTAGMSPSQYLQARREYWLQQRRAGVSQKEIDNGWDRDVQQATAAQNEASMRATQENQRLSTSMSGFNQALTSTSDLNKYLPVGSDLGGRAFEAMLGLQRAQAQRMGGYGSPTPPSPGVVPPAPTGASPPAQVAAIPQPPTAAAPPSAPAAAPAGPAPAPAARPAAPGPPSAPPAQPPGTASFPPDYGGNTFVPPTPGEPGGPPLRNDYPVYQPPGTASFPPDYGGNTFVPSGTAAAAPVGPAPPPSEFPPGVSVRPGGAGLPPPQPSSYGVAGDAVSMAPELPAITAARIMATPPWKMDEQTYRQAQALGLENQFWQVPGVFG